MKFTRRIGKLLLPLFPSLKIRLKQAEIRKTPSEYLGKSAIFSIFVFILIFSVLFVLSLILKFKPEFNIFVYIIPISVSILAFFYNIFYPSLVVARRVGDIEKNLLFFLRHLLIEIKSGINLYDAFLSVSKADYGAISQEFKKVIREISVGVPEITALEELMIKNPSLNFRRVIWQITNAIKSGTNLGNVIEELVKEFSLEQKTKIRMYGSQLNSLALIYMMFAIVVPSIGVTFLIILSFFAGFRLSAGILVLIFILVVVFQFLFMGMVKSMRPKTE